MKSIKFRYWSWAFMSIAALALMFSCEKDEVPGVSNNVVSDSGLDGVSEILMLVTVQTSDTTYLASNKLDSLHIYINNRFWSISTSDSIDLSNHTVVNNANIPESDQEVTYLVIASQTFEQLDFSTAGAISSYLNALYDLETGEYACMLSKFGFEKTDGTTMTLYPRQYNIFSVAEDANSAYAGHYVIKTY